MAFFKFRSKSSQGNETRGAAAAAPAESVESMRRRARHRLLGAVVLVLVGVIGFPMLFDTQPRPVDVDIPIEIPNRNKAQPLPVPATPSAPVVSGQGGDANSSRTASSGTMITERADGTEVAAATRVPVAPAPDAAPKPEPKPEPKPTPKPEPKPEARHDSRASEAPPPVKPKPAAPKPAERDDGSRALALLQDKPAANKPAEAKSASASKDAGGRVVVQVGAFADAAKVKETRQKLEKAGLKTFTTVAKTADGERTRVRVGPFASKAEADKAAERIKSLALPAAVLAP